MYKASAPGSQGLLLVRGNHDVFVLFLLNIDKQKCRHCALVLVSLPSCSPTYANNGFLSGALAEKAKFLLYQEETD